VLLIHAKMEEHANRVKISIFVPKDGSAIVQPIARVELAKFASNQLQVWPKELTDFSN